MKLGTSNSARALSLACMWLMGLGLLVTTGVALSIGFEDLFSPVSIAAQLLGLVFSLAGLTGLAGLAGLVKGKAFHRTVLGRRQVPEREKIHEPATWPIAVVFSGAVAGCYVDITIVWDSLGYPITITRIFGINITVTLTFIILVVLCFCLALVMLPALSAAWKPITKNVKGVGFSAALVGLVAQFWYVSTYAPANNPIGIGYAVSAGAMSGSGSDRNVQVNLTTEDTGTVAAIVLGSMLIVSGISYPSGNMTTLKVLQVFSDTSFLFPNDTVQYDFVVHIPDSRIGALNFKLIVDYARTNWLTIRQYRGSADYLYQCTQDNSDTQKEWYITESHLRYFTEGAKVLYSDYCEYPMAPATSPNIGVGIDGVRGGRLVRIPNQSPVGSDLGILQSVRNETIILG